MTDTTLLAIGPDDLGPALHIGDMLRCPICHGAHVVHGPDNGGEKLLFVQCGETLYLVGIAGQFWIGGGFTVARSALLPPSAAPRHS